MGSLLAVCGITCRADDPQLLRGGSGTRAFLCPDGAVFPVGSSTPGIAGGKQAEFVQRGADHEGQEVLCRLSRAAATKARTERPPAHQGGMRQSRNIVREKKKSAFVSAKIEMYGKLEDVCFYCIDLLWGKSLYQPLRFVLVRMGATNSILVSTKLDLDPETIIRLYSYRFRIETMFRELKQQIGGFAYRFWTKSLAKLSHFRKKADPSPLASIAAEKERSNILRTVRAIEMYALIASIAMGIVQAVSLKCADSLAGMYRWQRTPCKEKPSEANIMHCLRRQLYAVLAKPSENSILRLIQQHQTSPWDDKDSWAA